MASKLLIEFDYLLSLKNKTVKEVFEKMGYSGQTYYNRKKKPDNLTLAEIRTLAKESGIADEKLGNLIKSKP